MKIISIPTEKFRSQNPIFHTFYSALRNKGVDASDFSIRRLLSRDTELFQIHFPEHFAINFPPLSALLRCLGLATSILICKIRGIPCVWTVHNVEPFEMRNNVLYQLLMAFINRSVDGLVFLSKTSELQFREQFSLGSNKRVTFISHPCYPIQTTFKSTSEPIILAMVGEQKTYKQPLASLELYKAASKVLDCRLLIAGKVSEPERFRALLKTLSGNAPEWFDYRLNDYELELAAKRADFILLPYSRITNSGAALYALSCGRPIVTSNLPLFYELREFFGPAWVRVADGQETTLNFWKAPTAADFEYLQKCLQTISMDNVAEQYLSFFRSFPITQASRVASAVS